MTLSWPQRQAARWSRRILSAVGTPVANRLAPVVLVTLCLSGCSGDLTAPDDVRTSWQQLDYVAFDSSDTLRIGSTGSIQLLGGAGEPVSGLLGPATWRDLETAVAQALIAPLEPDPGTVGGAVWRRGHDGSTAGFRWDASTILTSAQADLVVLLDGLRAEALAPVPNESAGFLFAERLLHGHGAAGPLPEEFILRDEDALLDLLWRKLGRETLILPEVDFSRDMVLAIFLGEGSGRDYNVLINDTANWTLDGYLQVSVTVYRRGAACPIASEEQGAFDLVRLPKTQAQVFFHWDHRLSGCLDP